MIANGDLEDASTFYDLYGIPQETTGHYFKSQRLIKMFNKYTTNEHYQTNFNTILAFFENADPKGLASFEAGIQDTQLSASLISLASLAFDRITAIEHFLTKPKCIPANLNPVPGKLNPVPDKPKPELK
ncbi:hypothetical protein B9Z19DRAFT_1120722 [Tuber borchii]|uniref:Uncharacterized protein n=1 Tax=Tuber borchii TaxID=42251 RepID=A0A2T7A3W4_TUBBO|nr:hypothetical protein B9Z19DRAFT_1120722 [Tuber borchii]